MPHLRLALFVVLAGVAGNAGAEVAAPVVREEISALLSSVETSGCRFNRNGTWYAGADAKAHMMTKLDYVEKRTTLVSAEQFIELAASKSSMSGKPYLIQCGDQPAQPSETWLKARLKTLRGQ